MYFQVPGLPITGSNKTGEIIPCVQLRGENKISVTIFITFILQVGPEIFGKSFSFIEKHKRCSPKTVHE